MADGQVYVRVKADENSPMLMNAGSSGGVVSDISFGATVSWESSGGITGRYGWIVYNGGIPVNVSYVPGDIEATNRALAQALQNADMLDLMEIGRCVRFHTTN